MKRYLFVFVLLLLLAGCGKFDDLFELMEVAGAVETELAERHGLECRVMVNKVNGRLKTVSVVMDQKEVGDLTVADIAALVEPSVRRHFAETPEILSFTVMIRE